MSRDGVLFNAKLNDLVQQSEESFGLQTLDADCVDLILLSAEGFIESVIEVSAQLARHRSPQNAVLEPQDIRLHLEKEWHISIPGFNGPSNQEVVPLSLPSNVTTAHHQRSIATRGAKKEKGRKSSRAKIDMDVD